MTDAVNTEFAERLRRIEAARPRSAVPAAGLARPWRKTEIGLKLAGLAAAAVIGLKAVLIVDIGPTDYELHRQALAKGSLLDRLAAQMMTPDPVTLLARLVVQNVAGSATAVETAAGNVAATAATSPNDSPVKATVSTLNFGGAADSGPRLTRVQPVPPKPAGPKAAAVPHPGRAAVRGGINFLQAPQPKNDMAMTGLAAKGPTTRGMAGMFVSPPKPDSPSN